MHKLVTMNGPRILLIVGGGIAAYKACELVRLIRRNGGEVTCVLTEGGAQFVTAMSLAALSENPVHTTLWDLTTELEMGHIQLSRAADLVVACPATANLLAKMAKGIADDLATTLLLATDKPVLVVPAMNVKMWEHSATQANIRTLTERGIAVLDPDEGPMACGEYGPGRLPEPPAVWNTICQVLSLEMLALPAPEPELDLALFAAPMIEGDEPAEDEPAEAESFDSGLGGLSSGLIQRKTRTRIVFDDDPLPEGAVEASEAEQAEFMAVNGVPVDPELAAVPPPEVLLAGPLLSKKGKARAAPPTDPDAINHLVADQVAPEITGGPPPEPLAEALAEDPLFGQPDFAGDEPTAGEPDGADANSEHKPATAIAEEPAAPDEAAAAPAEAAKPQVEQRLKGKHILITAGPTHEPIDPVRFIANRSSGKQGYAIAAAAAELGARVTLVSGPVALECPPGVDRIFIETARDMAGAVKKSLPADAAVMVAAVADWRTTEVAGEKMKKRGSAPPSLRLTENPDILTLVASSDKRPRLVVGFAAETENIIPNAKEKRKRKGANWIIANDVSGPTGKGVMGGEFNSVHIVTEAGIESLAEMPKEDVARAIVERIADALAK